ncbi:alpha/beta-hydrolase [Chloropicon primus]|uniref:Alpha/beta-hydrolase n=2 Tax=Chloropicon primus TaxID=1764295 RepID=A0A5B8MV10_9CHLO|nr:alpha/beta-hydrolase [Chloropicon primus]UPR02544.1 alpha/beta-hydrolase [Chloropicon primus]|eukprot:QDZ23332.1 alpha/beta-hydrolase [Chloropicon primus]
MRALDGTLFKYGPKSANVAFRYGKNDKVAIVVGGLTDGLFATSYVDPLCRELDGLGISTVQTLLTSSHQGYGVCSLDEDAGELADLVSALQRESDPPVSRYGVIGHSTGCQDAVRFCLRGGKPDFVVLQAPVSDRESLGMHGQTEKNIKLAEDLVAQSGGQEVLMPLSTQEDGSPITARRFLSLAAKGGDDEAFSSDLTDTELKNLLGHMDGVPTLVLQSGADEYIPHSEVDAVGQAKRLAAAMGSRARSIVIEGGSHALEDHTDEAVSTIKSFIMEVMLP